MATARQIAANKRNSRLSTGPRTAAGKAKSAMNPLKHGLATQQIVLPHESATDFEAFVARQREALVPVGATEELFVEMFVIQMWRSRRGAEFEAALHQRALQEANIDQLVSECRTHSPFAVELQKVAPATSTEYDRADAKRNTAVNEMERDPLFSVTRTFEKYHRELENVARYEDRHVRAALRFLDQLQRLQMERSAKPVPAPGVVDVSVAVDRDRAAIPPATDISVERVDKPLPTSTDDKEN